MNISLISTPFFGVPPPGYSGLEQILWDSACALTELGHKVVVFAPGNKNPPKGFLYKTGEPINKVEVNWIEEERKMWGIYKDKLTDFDICHSHDWFSFIYASKAENPSLKCAHTHHGGLNLEWWGRSKPPFKLNLIAISDWMVKVYASQGFTARRVYNGINLEKYPFKKEKGDRLLFVGRFSAFKQPHVAIEVAKKLDMPIDLVGGTFVDSPEYLEKIKRMCDGDKVKMYPDAPHEVKLQLMQDAKCLLFPSRMGEPFGLVSCEAAACGTPTVALRDGAIAEVVEDGVTGYVRDTPEQMIEAVKKIYNIKTEACRRRVHDNFSRQVMARGYIEKAYEPVMRGEEW